MLGQAGESFSSPRTLDIFPASMTHVYVEDVDALHTRARNAGPSSPTSTFHQRQIDGSLPLIPKVKFGLSPNGSRLPTGSSVRARCRTLAQPIVSIAFPTQRRVACCRR